MRFHSAVAPILFLLAATGYAADFPESWEGTWIGKMKGGPSEIEMRLVIAPIDSGRWHWRITYGNEPERPYQLHVVDQAKGHYLIDEQNGILIDQYLVEDRLSAAFTVNGKLILFDYEMTPNGISIVAPSFNLANFRTTAGAGATVCSFALGGTQRGLLEKK